ncbi:hypothetical protein Harman_33180 [Haloarcula mannanilytica]|uniref:Uncharacterized protein n=1 Tax=Haloarcula mannanilytica TaxID=2509225 RepID=A0A4C2ES25_9EURY|nr:hypothetical protein Harman_33180 [Haloarcula mannanilytica]
MHPNVAEIPAELRLEVRPVGLREWPTAASSALDLALDRGFGWGVCRLCRCRLARARGRSLQFRLAVRTVEGFALAVTSTTSFTEALDVFTVALGR